MFVKPARRSASRRSGGRSIDPACSSACARIATVPPLVTNVSPYPPTSTSRNASTKAASATGLAASAPNTAPTICCTLPASTSSTSAPSRSTTRNTPPTTGTASSSFSVPSATNCTTTSGQFAAATSAPRLSAAFSEGGWDIGQALLSLPFAVSCCPSCLLQHQASWRAANAASPGARCCSPACWSRRRAVRSAPGSNCGDSGSTRTRPSAASRRGSRTISRG